MRFGCLAPSTLAGAFVLLVDCVDDGSRASVMRHELWLGWVELLFSMPEGRPWL